MAALSQRDQLALHEFSVAYRAALAKQATPQQSLDTVKDAVRDQYEQEQIAKQSPTIEPQSPSKEPEPQEPEP
jgi:hypothetical protein